MMQNSKRPFISVLVLSYNYGKWLKRSLDACAAQTFRDFEIIMINNASTDDTEKVWKRFCAENPEIPVTYVLTDKNYGIAGWNRGFDFVQGEYVIFNDADDWMEPNCLELLAKKALETGADRVVAEEREVTPDGNIWRVTRFPKKDVRIPSTMYHATLFRYSVIRDNGLKFPDTFFTAIDTYFVYNFAAMEETGGYCVREVLYNFFYNLSSITSKSKTPEEDYALTFLPFLQLTKEAMQKTDDVSLRNEMEYRFVRNTLAAVVACYRDHDKETADTYYLSVRDALRRELPGYYKNPLIWNILNGFTLGGSVGTFVIAFLDMFRAKGIICLIASSCGKNSRQLRMKRNKEAKE